MNALLARFRALPVAGRWIVALIVILVLYIGVMDPVLTKAESLRSRAATLETALSRERELASSDEGDGAKVQTAQSTFGRPRLPGDSRTTPEALYRLVNTILESHGVFDRNVNEKTVRMTSDQVVALGVGGIDRLILEVSFEADPAVVFEILSDLERSPDVAAVSRIKIDKSSLRSDRDSDLVRATLAPEAWLVARGGAAQ